MVYCILVVFFFKCKFISFTYTKQYVAGRASYRSDAPAVKWQYLLSCDDSVYKSTFLVPNQENDIRLLVVCRAIHIKWNFIALLSHILMYGGGSSISTVCVCVCASAMQTNFSFLFQYPQLNGIIQLHIFCCC